MLALNQDLKQLPGRNSPGFPRHSGCKRSLPISFKLKTGLRLLNMSMAASCLVLLAGDVSINPGPNVEK